MLVLLRPDRILLFATVLVTGLFTGPGPHARARQATTPGVWGDVTLPGGPRTLLASAGLVTTIEEWRAVPAVIEQFYGGLNPRVPREFGLYGSRASKEPDSVAPLPLGTEFWARVLAKSAPHERVLATILSNRSWASLYYGLLSMDTATLTAIQGDPALSSMLIRLADRLPVHAKALRVRSGRMDVPGGEAFAPFWTDLVGSPERPAAFIETLLTKDDGRLGYFYNTIDALPSEGLAFVSGATDVSLDERRKRFRAFYGVFAESMPTWDGPARRFFPMRGGPAPALFGIALEEDGSIVGPPWLDFWTRALAGERAVAGFDDRRTADVVDLLRLLCPGGACNEDKTHTLAFVQRQANAWTRELVGPLLAAARTRVRYPALALELERLQLDDLQIYAAASEVAERIDDLPRDARRIALAQFQGAITLLRRLRAAGRPSAEVARHLGAFLAVPLRGDGYRGGALRWLVTDVLNDPEDIDDAAMRALAGSLPPGPTIEWEGLRYRVDVTATELERIRSVRSRFTSADLASAWALLQKGARTADRAAAEAFLALTYSASIEDTTASLALSRELPQRHDFFSRAPGQVSPAPWTLGSVRLAPGGMRHVGGSLLALESGAPELASRRMSAERPSDRARISPVLADGLLRTAALTSLWVDATDEAVRIVSAVERGTTLASDSARLEAALATAGIAGPRAGWIRWAARRGQPAPASVLRLEDLVRLGDPDLTTRSIGAAAIPVSCLCLQFPKVSWEVRGQPADHFVAAALSVEGPLRVAYELRARNLPNVLAHGVLSLLMSDLVQAGSLAHPADVHGVSDTVRRVPATRFDDYIAAVAARGPLMPLSSGGIAAR